MATDPRCPIDGFIVSRRWMYYLTKLTVKGVREINRQRPKFFPKYIVDRWLIVRCEECGMVIPEVWDTQAMTWKH